MKLLNSANLDRKSGIPGLTNDGVKPFKVLSFVLSGDKQASDRFESQQGRSKSSHPTGYPCTKSETLQFELWTQNHEHCTLRSD
jgi:hypothetical protein